MSENWVDISPEKDKKILKQIIQEGTVEDENNPHPIVLSNVITHYIGHLDSTGLKFDSSRDKDKPFSFLIGCGNVIKGWDIGIMTMKKGEICKLKIHPDFAYGKRGHTPTIGPNETLIFEVELISWEIPDCLLNENILSAYNKNLKNFIKQKKKKKINSEIPKNYKTINKEEVMNLTEIKINQLKLDENPKRYLSGTLVVEPYFFGPVFSVLKDDLGVMRNLKVSNVPNKENNFGFFLKNGSKVVIKEPLYRKFGINVHGIHVEKFSNILFDKDQKKMDEKDVLKEKNKKKNELEEKRKESERIFNELVLEEKVKKKKKGKRKRKKKRK